MIGDRIHHWVIVLASAAVLMLLPAARVQNAAEMDEEIVSQRCECAARHRVQPPSTKRGERRKASRTASHNDRAEVMTSVRTKICDCPAHEERFALNGIGAPLRC